MPADPRILALLEQVRGDSFKEQRAARLLHWYAAEVLKLLGTVTDPSSLNRSIEERGEELYMHMCNVVEPMMDYDPAPLLSAPLDQLTQAQLADYYTLHLIIRTFPRLWDTVGFLGFVTKEKDHVPHLLACLELIRMAVAYTHCRYSS